MARLYLSFPKVFRYGIINVFSRLAIADLRLCDQAQRCALDPGHIVEELTVNGGTRFH